MWDLFTGRLARKYTGQRQGRHIIRSCFSGVDVNFVVSGSEGIYGLIYGSLALVHSYRHIVYAWGVLLDGNVYIWHQDHGVLLDVLAGHGSGSVNSVAWNPRNTQMFASCSDDFTIRLWEPLCNGAESSSTLGLAHRAAGEQNHESEPSGKGKGKSRESWIEDDPAARSP